MSIEILEVRNCKYKSRIIEHIDAEGNVTSTENVLDTAGNPIKDIDCEAKFSHIPDEWLPFTATHDDVEEHGKTLYQNALNGDYGTIADEGGE